MADTTKNDTLPPTTDESADSGAEQTPSKEREVHDVNTGSIIALDRNLSKADLKAKMVEILDRGVTSSRLDLDTQDDIYYEWVPNNAVEKNRMRTLGFEVLSRNQHLKSGNPLHEGGGDEIIVGDVIAMGCHVLRKAALDEIKQDRFVAMHGRAGSRTQAEENEFQQKMNENLKDSGISTTIESNTHNIGTAELLNAVKNT